MDQQIQTNGEQYQLQVTVHGMQQHVILKQMDIVYQQKQNGNGLPEVEKNILNPDLHQVVTAAAGLHSRTRRPGAVTPRPTY